MTGNVDEGPPLGQLGISSGLRAFVSEMPLHRRRILDFVRAVAVETSAHETVLDLGAGDGPYRELFDHATYISNDWEESVHPGARSADVVAPAWDLPLDSSSIDLVLATELLEHVPDPGRVLRECARVIKAGGRLAVTVPMTWQLHELPHDYFRFTPAGIEELMRGAGFIDCEAQAGGDSFSTLAQLILNTASTLGQADDGLNDLREHVRGVLYPLAAQIAQLAPLDARGALPLGCVARARRP